MTKVAILRAASLAILALGAIAQPFAHGVSATTLADPDAEVAPATARRALLPGDSIVLNITASIPVLDSLRGNERWEQVADWAVYGTLFQSTLSPVDIRNAMYDKVPLRVPGIEAAANLDYGPGRRVIQKDGSIWLFYASDMPRTATLARLADQVRMEVGSIPERFSVFAIRSNLSAGAITVRREADIAGRTLFSPEFGYTERTVRSLDELKAWVRDVDDLTHVRMVDGGVDLGGRRLPESRTAGITLDDVAALYQAHQTLAGKREQLATDKTPVEQAWTALLETFNENVVALNASKYASVDSHALDAALAVLDARLAGGPSANSDPVAAMLRQLNSDTNAGHVGVTSGYGLESYRSSITQRRPRVEEAVAQEHAARLRAFSKENGWTLSEAPGFSLDPEVDSAVLEIGRRTLIQNPGVLIARARAVAQENPYDSTGRNPMPLVASAAHEVVDAFAFGQSPGFQRMSRDISEGIRPDSSFQDTLGVIQLGSLLEFVTVGAKLQCARYDGPLNGTHVGMVLFYTDLLAKIWTIDYARSAPVDSVFGFLSALEVGERAEREPVYWREADSLSRTRLWFGPKKDAYASRDDDSELNFAHMATRVFSAGSDPAKPGVETRTAELIHRSIRWWDQNLAAVADHEPAYHVQNQIMKWSVVTGMLAEQRRLSELADVPIDHSLRFDRWYGAHHELRYRRPLKLLPQERWPAKTECMDLLLSPEFRRGGTIRMLSGGVSLGGAKTIGEGTRIAEAVAPSLRRGGLDFAASGAEELTTLRSVKFRLPATSGLDAASVEIKLARLGQVGDVEATMLRGQGTVFHVTDLTSRVENLAGGARAFQLRAGPEELASVSLRPTSNSIALVVRDGAAAFDRRFLDVVANKAAREGDLSRAIAAHPEVLPRSAYVVGDGKSQTIVFGRTAETGDHARALELVSGEGESGSPRWITSAGADITNRTPSEQVARVSALRLDYADGLAKVNAARWQRISGGRGENVARFFGAAPSDRATAISLRTGDKVLPTLNARVDGGVVYLERPPNPAANGAFNDFVLDHGITGDHVAGIAERARGGAATVDFVADIQKPAAHILGDHIVAGDTRGMLRFLAQQSDAGKLDQSFVGLREYVSDRGFGAYGSGKPSAASDLFMTADRASAAPNDLIYRAISDVRRGDVASALEDVSAAFERGAPTKEALDAADKVFRDAGHGGDIGKFGRWRNTGVGGNAGAGEARIVQDGFREHLAVFMKPRREGIPASPEFRKAHASDIVHRDAIYVDEGTLADRNVLRERDPDLAPGRFVADVVLDARIDMAAFDLDRTFGLPKKLVVDGRVYQRVDTPAVTAGSVRGVWVARARCGDEASRRNDSCRRAA